MPLETRLSKIANKPYVKFLNDNFDIWDIVMCYLQPMDIVLLALATSFRIRPSSEQIPIYIKWWEQVFNNMRWVQNGSKITIIEKGLSRLKTCLESWTYEKIATKLDLLVVVQETLLATNIRDERRQGLLQSINKDIPYASTSVEHLVRAFDRPIQMCVLFLEDNIYIDPDQT